MQFKKLVTELSDGCQSQDCWPLQLLLVMLLPLLVMDLSRTFPRLTPPPSSHLLPVVEHLLPPRIGLSGGHRCVRSTHGRPPCPHHQPHARRVPATPPSDVRRGRRVPAIRHPVLRRAAACQAGVVVASWRVIVGREGHAGDVLEAGLAQHLVLLLHALDLLLQAGKGGREWGESSVGRRGKRGERE